MNVLRSVPPGGPRSQDEGDNLGGSQEAEEGVQENAGIGAQRHSAADMCKLDLWRVALLAPTSLPVSRPVVQSTATGSGAAGCWLVLASFLLPFPFLFLKHLPMLIE